MYFTLLIFVCITLSSIEAGSLPKPKPYHPLRGANRHTIRLHPIQMRDAEEPPDNYSWRRFNLQHPRNDENSGDQDYVHVTYPNKNNDMVLDIVRQMAKDLKNLDQRTNSFDDLHSKRSQDSIEDSTEAKNLFGSKGYVHLTYPSKPKNNMLSDIARELEKSLRMLETKSVEDSTSNYNLRSKDEDFFRDIEIKLLNPNLHKQKNLEDEVKKLLKSLRIQEQTLTSDNQNVRTFDTIVHFEEPRRILDNDNNEFHGIEYEDLSDLNKEGLVLDVAKRLAKDESERASEKDYQDYLNNVERRADTDSSTPKLVYEFNELVI